MYNGNANGHLTKEEMSQLVKWYLRNRHGGPLGLRGTADMVDGSCVIVVRGAESPNLTARSDPRKDNAVYAVKVGEIPIVYLGYGIAVREV